MTDWIEYFENSNRTLFRQANSKSKRRLIEIVLEKTPAKGKILEAGCGTANLSILLADSGYRVVAMDYSEEIVNYAREKCCLSPERLKFMRGDILRLSEFFENKEFDTVCHSGVLEHFSDEDIIRSLQEHRKVSARAIFNVPNNRSKVTARSFGDERLMSNRKWGKLIRAAGYDHVKVYGGSDVWPPSQYILPGVFFQKRLSFWWKWTSRHSIFLCE